MNAKNKLLVLFLVFFPVLSNAQENLTIKQLFDSLKVNPNTVSSQITADKALQYKKIATGNLYPEIYAFGKYDYSSEPMGMLPVPPNELIKMVQNPSLAQPFSENILRAGINISMPIFVKSIYSTAAKAQKMYEAAQMGAEIEFQKNQAILVGANANLLYIENLESALKSKRLSVEKIKELVEIKVKNGRAPESALFILITNLNDLDLNIAQLSLNKEKAIASIYSLTNIKLDSAVSLTQVADFQEGEFKVLEPLQLKIEATRLGAKAETDKLYPALIANANYVYNQGNSYNNNQLVSNNFTSAGITLKIPLFEKAQYSKIKLGKIDVSEQENELDKMRLQLTAEANQYENSLEILARSIELNKKSIVAKQELLNIAKESFLKERMTIEDYLKYEDDLLFEKAKLYQTQAEKWQTLMKLAVIYGNNIEEIVK